MTKKIFQSILLVAGCVLLASLLIIMGFLYDYFGGVEKNQLRDELRLTSVKDGCSEGACGTCHVLIDGKATKACVPSTDMLEG